MAMAFGAIGVLCLRYAYLNQWRYGFYYPIVSNCRELGFGIFSGMIFLTLAWGLGMSDPDMGTHKEQIRAYAWRDRFRGWASGFVLAFALFVLFTWHCA
jgi:hypothetical protein